LTRQGKAVRLHHHIGIGTAYDEDGAHGLNDNYSRWTKSYNRRNPL
jgi:hypothetical protein